MVQNTACFFKIGVSEHPLCLIIDALLIFNVMHAILIK